MSDAEDFELEFGPRMAEPELDCPIVVECDGERQAITQDAALQMTGIKHEHRAVYFGPGGFVTVAVGKTLTFANTAFLLTAPEDVDLEDI